MTSTNGKGFFSEYSVDVDIENEEDFINAQKCLKIDLASCPGILARDTIYARGLPGIHAPESSGQLIADTVFRLLLGE